MDPGLVIIRVRSNVNGGKVGNGVGGVPVVKGQFCGNGCVLGQLFEFGPPVVFSARDADGGGTHVAMAVLVVASLSVAGVEIKFYVDRIGGTELGKGVMVWVNPELVEAGTPLFGTKSGGGEVE